MSSFWVRLQFVMSSIDGHIRRGFCNWFERKHKKETQITLTPPTVGRWSAGRIGRYSTDSWSIFCPTLENWFSRHLEKNITTRLYFFHRPTVLRFWSSVWHRPFFGRLSSDNRPIRLDANRAARHFGNSRIVKTRH